MKFDWDDFYRLDVSKDTDRSTELHSCSILRNEFDKDDAFLSTGWQDKTTGVDIVVKDEGKEYKYACRYRTSKWYKYSDEFTIRLQNHGSRTEINKLDNIDYSIYCVLSPEGKPPAWFMYDMSIVRKLIQQNKIKLAQIPVRGGQIMGVGKIDDIIPAVRAWNDDHPYLTPIMEHKPFFTIRWGRFWQHTPGCEECGIEHGIQHDGKYWWCRNCSQTDRT